VAHYQFDIDNDYGREALKETLKKRLKLSQGVKFLKFLPFKESSISL
jgi:hypothetical protein